MPAIKEIKATRDAIETLDGKPPRAPESEVAKARIPIANAKPDGAPDGFCAYIGPSIVGVIQSGTIYPGSKKTVLASIGDAVERYPLIASLVVEGNTLPVDRIKVKTPGNLLYVNYKKLLSGQNN